MRVQRQPRSCPHLKSGSGRALNTRLFLSSFTSRDSLSLSRARSAARRSASARSWAWTSEALRSRSSYAGSHTHTHTHVTHAYTHTAMIVMNVQGIWRARAVRKHGALKACRRLHGTHTHTHTHTGDTHQCHSLCLCHARPARRLQNLAVVLCARCRAEHRRMSLCGGASVGGGSLAGCRHRGAQHLLDTYQTHTTYHMTQRYKRHNNAVPWAHVYSLWA